MHSEKFLVNKKTLNIKSFMLNNYNKDLFELLEVDYFICNTHDEAVKKQQYFDTTVKFN